MRHSSFGALVLLLLLIAFAVLLFTPHQRQSSSTAQVPGTLWGSKP